MACSSMSTAASSEEEKKEQMLIDVMFLCDEWKSSKGGLSTFNREFAINLAETTTGNMKIHCYVSQSDDRDREDAKQRGVNLITAEAVPGSRDPLDWLKVQPPKLQHPHVVIGHGRKLGAPACHIQRATRCKWIQFVHVFCEDLGKFKETTATAVTDTIEENEGKHKMEIELCKAADAVVAVGSRLQHKYSGSLPNMEVGLITPGIVENFCNESIESREHAGVLLKTLNALKKKKKKFKVFMFGRATYEDLTLKGYDIVANAIGSLGGKFELTFVGSSSGGHRNLEQWFLKKTCIKRRQITIRGYCTEQDELKGMFHQSDLVALPSRTEGFGLVALEAISSGAPILVSGESGVAEALQEVEGGNSVIVESDDDALEWARRIGEVSSQSPEEREAKARQLRENYRKVYPWRKECKRFKGLIENVVKTANDGKSSIKVDVEHVKLADQDASSTPSVSTMEPAGCQKAATAPGTNRKRRSDTDLEDLQPLEKKVLCRIAMNYLNTIPPQSKDEHNEFHEYLQKMKVLITGVSVGSLVITVKYDSLKSLEELWKDYSCGLLDKMVQDCFVTEKILKELNLAELKLKTTMDTEEYNACKLYFERVALRGTLSSEVHAISSTSESPQKQEEPKKWKQKTRIEEIEKMKGTPPLAVISTTGKRKELEEPTEKIGTSPSTKLSTAGHGKELEGKLKTMKFVDEKSTWSLPASTTSDPQEELEKPHLKLQGMEVTSPSAVYSTSGHEKEEILRNKAMKLQKKKGTSLSTKLSTAGHGKKLEEKPKTMKPHKEKRILPLSEEELEELLLKLQRLKGSSPSVALPTTGYKKELEGRQKTLKLQEKKGSLPSSPLSTTDLEEELEELRMKLKRLRKEGTQPPPELFIASLEELKKLCMNHDRQRWKGSSPLPVSFHEELEELLKKLEKKWMEALENTMYPTIRSGLAKFDVRLPEELQSYVSYLLNESAKLGSRRRVLHSPSAVEELQEAMDEYELKAFLTIHIREGAWQVVLLFMDELSSFRLPWGWYNEMWYEDEDEDEEMISSSSYSSTSGILQAWPAEYDPDLVTLCKAITDRDWKVTKLILSGSRISDDGLKNLSTALTQGELYSLSLHDNGLQRRGLKHLCEALISRDCNLTSLSVIHNRLGDKEMMHLFNALTSVNCQLTSLDVSDCELGDKGLMHLCNALTSVHCKLTSLNVSDSALGDKGIMHLCNALTSVHCKLTSLNVRDSALGDQGIMHLCKALTCVNCKLTSLNVSDNRLRDEGLLQLCNLLTSVNGKVTSLNIGESCFGSEGLKHLRDTLTSVNCKITRLNVSSSALEEEGVVHLCKALTSVNCNLTSLNVSNNRLGDKGIMHLCYVLTSVNCKLTSLNVSWTHFGSKGLKHLCDALISTNCTLTSLNVRGNVLGDEGIISLFTIVTSRKCTLTRLNVRSNRLGDRVLKDLARAVTSKNCALTSLDISWNEMGDEGIKYLCEALTDTNCKLRSLNLYGNWKVTDVGKHCLSEAITGTDWEVREGLILSRPIESEA